MRKGRGKSLNKSLRDSQLVGQGAFTKENGFAAARAAVRLVVLLSDKYPAKITGGNVYRLILIPCL
jgi:hypothetical protein